MIKLFSELKIKEPDLYQEVIKACKSEPDSNQWFVTKTFGELKQAAKYVNAHSWNINMYKLQQNFTSYEWTILNTLINSNKPEKISSREQLLVSATQKTVRFVERYLKDREYQKQIDEIEAKKSGKVKASASEDWQNLQKIFN